MKKGELKVFSDASGLFTDTINTAVNRTFEMFPLFFPVSIVK